MTLKTASVRNYLASKQTKLNFENHVYDICKKAGGKLNPLARIPTNTQNYPKDVY